jgi:hypothetical protein
LKYDPVGAALRRRVAAGECPFCGAKLVQPKLKPMAAKVCLNEKCGRGRGRQVKMRG